MYEGDNIPLEAVSLSKRWRSLSKDAQLTLNVQAGKRLLELHTESRNVAARPGLMVLTILYKIHKSAAGLLEGDEGEIMEEEPTCIHRNLHFTGVPDNEMALQIQKGTGPTPLPYHGVLFFASIHVHLK